MTFPEDKFDIGCTHNASCGVHFSTGCGGGFYGARPCRGRDSLLGWKTALFRHGYGWAMDDSESFVKVLAHAETRKLLGAHIIGPHSSMLIQPLIDAMHFGHTVNELGARHNVHPPGTYGGRRSRLYLTRDRGKELRNRTTTTQRNRVLIAGKFCWFVRCAERFGISPSASVVPETLHSLRFDCLYGLLVAHNQGAVNGVHIRLCGRDDNVGVRTLSGVDIAVLVDADGYLSQRVNTFRHGGD